MSNPRVEAKRTARIIRSGSSLKDCSGATGVRRSPAARSSRPPNGSMNSREGRRTAIAFTVKSRRERSPSIVSPYATCGFRDCGSYSSVRYVVISTLTPSSCAPSVPNSRPMSQIAPRLPTHCRRICSVDSGRADVVKSRSSLLRPRRASRTGPPTSANSSPAVSNMWPSS